MIFVEVSKYFGKWLQVFGGSIYSFTIAQQGLVLLTWSGIVWYFGQKNTRLEAGNQRLQDLYTFLPDIVMYVWQV